MMNQTVQKRASKACDACKRRKVKCNGEQRCQQCSHLGLHCIYSQTAKPRSQGRRGHVISEFRNQTASASLTSPPILPALSVPTTFQAPERNNVGSYCAAFFLDLLPDYITSVYPLHPVISECELREYAAVMDSDREVRSFMYAFGACTLNLTRYGDSRTEEVVQMIEDLMNRSIQNVLPAGNHYRTSVMRATQSVYIHNCLMSLQSSDAAFFYMRDAITHIEMLRVDNVEQAAALPPPERSRRQRLYWQAYIHERFVAILDYRQAILPPLYTLPEDDPTISTQVHEGFIQIIRLFSLLDTEFLSNWLGSRGGNVTSTWVEAKSLELEGDAETDAREHANLSMMQRADLTITREWLRTLVWRLAMGQTLLSSRSTKECLSLLFPVRLSQTLRQQVSNMSRHDIEVHGSSITQKLFEITDTIADVLIHVPAATLDETALRIDDFLFILDFVLLFPQLDHTRRGILLDKLERLQTMFPEAVSNASSPNLLLEVHSPLANDPWGKVVQSKIAAGLEDVTDVQGRHGEQAGSGRLATWNDISRRLSMATFDTE